MNVAERDRQIAVWDSYQQQANPIVVENDDGSWTNATIGDLLDLIAEATRERTHSASQPVTP